MSQKPPGTLLCGAFNAVAGAVGGTLGLFGVGLSALDVRGWIVFVPLTLVVGSGLLLLSGILLLVPVTSWKATFYFALVLECVAALLYAGYCVALVKYASNGMEHFDPGTVAFLVVPATAVVVFILEVLYLSFAGMRHASHRGGEGSLPA